MERAQIRISGENENQKGGREGKLMRVWGKLDIISEENDQDEA
jgi:hypothetical protein